MWYYNNSPVKTISDLPDSEELVGFVYKITNMYTGKFYIGKKSLYHNRRTKISKKEKTTTKTRKTFKVTTKESDWLTYYGSSEVLKNDIKALGVEKFHREILEVCKTKKYLNYCELHWQVKLEVLKNGSYNGNILGRYYPRDME